jgi:hypothetical protein
MLKDPDRRKLDSLRYRSPSDLGQFETPTHNNHEEDHSPPSYLGSEDDLASSDFENCHCEPVERGKVLPKLHRRESQMGVASTSYTGWSRGNGAGDPPNRSRIDERSGPSTSNFRQSHENDGGKARVKGKNSPLIRPNPYSTSNMSHDSHHGLSEYCPSRSNAFFPDDEPENSNLLDVQSADSRGKGKSIRLSNPSQNVETSYQRRSLEIGVGDHVFPRAKGSSQPGFRRDGERTTICDSSPPTSERSSNRSGDPFFFMSNKALRSKPL